MSDSEPWIVVWRQPDELWRWRWVHASDFTVIVSHKAFESRSEAEQSAAQAYPGVPIRVREDELAERRRQHRRRRLLRLLMAALTLFALRRLRRDRRNRRTHRPQPQHP